MKITGTLAVRGSPLSRRQTSKPSISGMRTSRSTRSGVARCALSSACAPLRVNIKSKPCSARKSEIRRRFWGLSSTISSVVPFGSLGDSIAMRPQVLLQQRDQLLLVEPACQAVNMASERAQGVLSFQVQRHLLDTYQLAQARELKQCHEPLFRRRQELRLW